MTLTNEQAAKMVQTIEGNAPFRSYLEQFDVDIPALCATVRHLRKQLDDALVRAAEDQDYDSEQRAVLAKENERLTRERNEALDQCAELHRQVAGIK